MKKDSLEFRQLQRERILKTKPWLNSTGAKTQDGKEKSKMNALKCNPALHQLLKQSRELFKEQRELRKILVRNV